MPARVRPIRSFVAIVILVLLATPARADAELPNPLSDGWGPPASDGGAGTTELGAFSRPSWLAVRFDVQSTTSVTWTIHSDFADSTSAGLGLWLLRGSSIVDNELSIHRDRNPNAVYAEFDAAGINVVALNEASGGGAGGRDLTLTDTLSPGTYTGVGVAVADGTASGSVGLTSGGAVGIAGVGIGQDVFLRDERSFSGLADVYMQQAYLVRAKAIVGASRTELVAHSLFGWFGTVNDPGALLHSDGPDGHRDGLQQYVYAGAPAGSYTMTIDADTGGPGSATGSFGADVSLP